METACERPRFQRLAQSSNELSTDSFAKRPGDADPRWICAMADRPPLDSRLYVSPLQASMSLPRITTDPDALGGTPVFAGTRVPVRILFEHLEAGDPLDVFLRDFPTVERRHAVAVLEEARLSVAPDAHPA
jgi:uncharacterized protein (DUF433 family)